MGTALIEALGAKAVSEFDGAVASMESKVRQASPEIPTTADARSQRLRSAEAISAGHAFVQNLHRGHYELGTDVDSRHRIPHGFTELAAFEPRTAAHHPAHHATTQQRPG